MPTKSMLNQPVGIFILVVAVVIGIVYVLYPTMFRNEETEAFVHPVPPGDASEDDGYEYHYREAC